MLKVIAKSALLTKWVLWLLRWRWPEGFADYLLVMASAGSTSQMQG
jgi:hypothetical protein